MWYLFYCCWSFDIDVAVYFAAICSSFLFLLFRKGRLFRQQFLFILCSFAIQQNVTKFFKQVFPAFLYFCYSVAWNQGFSSNNMFLFSAFWSSAEFPISKYYFVCFCHLTEWQANMFFLFVFMSFSRMEPRLFKHQYFLKFDFYHILKLILFKKWVLF